MSAAAYSLLHEGVQKAIFRRGWKELHSIQVQSIKAVLGGAGHLLICAHTAGGKTEAAFLPVISSLAENPRASVQALYIGPLIALINDQFARLETLCQDVEVPVHRWHGAASATEKRKLRDSPGGILLITPESLESNFINYGIHLHRIYAELEFVVIDELHSFLSNVRGVHLRSLLARLSAVTGRTPRVIGLSATIGDPKGARSFVAPDAPQTVEIIEGSGDQTIKFGVKAYLRGEETDDQKMRRSHPNAVFEAVASLTTSQAKEAKPLGAFSSLSLESSDETDDLDDIAADILHTCGEGTNLVFGNAKQGLEILADRLHARVRALRLPHDPFHVHHGSLSKDVREETEAILKSGRPATVLCSSTLEMGIDIGSVRRVAQLDPPWSVASMRQRLGRSGRRRGEPAIMRVYSRDESPHAASTVTDLLFPKLLRSVALARLMFGKWLEPHEGDRLDLSTFVHQTISCLRETGGMRARDLFTLLCLTGAFRNVSEQIFARVLRSLGTHEIIEQMPTGEIILAPKGERIVSDRDFYAAFAGTDECSVRHDAHEIGKLQTSLIPPVGENLILGGKRWLVVNFDSLAKTVMVKPARGGKPPVFRGAGGEMHNRVANEMRAVLAAIDEPPFLDGAGQLLLKAARTVAANSGVLSPGFIVRANSIEWYPWSGTRALQTLLLHARCDGLSADVGPLSITYKSIEPDRLRLHIVSVVRDSRTPLELASRMGVKTFEKFDEFLSEDLLDEANARDRLDIATAVSCAEVLLKSLSSATEK